MDFSPSQIKEWIGILGTPTLGVVLFIVLILYREAVIYFLKAAIDVVKSYLIRK
jgi:hypothetical protein